MPMKAPQFRPAGWKPAKRQRNNAFDSFYDTKEWRELRQQCRQRDGHRCADPDCETPMRGYGGRLIADHIISRREGGPDTLENLILRCASCDNRKHGRRGPPRA